MAAGPGRRFRFPPSGLLAVAAVAALAGGAGYLARGALWPGQASGQAAAGQRATAAGCGAAAAGPCAGSPAGPAVAAPPAVVTVPPRKAGPGPSAPAPTGPRPRPAGRTTGPPPAGPAPAQGGTAPAQGGTAAAQVLALVNQARSAAGLPALTVTPGLEASSSAHDLRMAGGCGLSHQCPGEPPIGDRETAAGVGWTAAGENIGEGGPAADAPAAIARLAVGLTQAMLNEQPPDDGHRRNILSATFTHIGIAVCRDSSGTVWLTQDFSS